MSDESHKQANLNLGQFYDESYEDDWGLDSVSSYFSENEKILTETIIKNKTLRDFHETLNIKYEFER